jgi:alginate O-acetyltransferase complex protein AlgI
MIFSSLRFFLFLAVTLAVLGLLSSRDIKKRVLALASCFFYAAWDWRFLGLLLTISVIDYFCALQIAKTDQPAKRRFWLGLSICSNLGILGWFKYCNFFIENFNVLLEQVNMSVPHLDILLPAGISFYTFKTMSYTIDVYRKEIALCRSWLDYATFITFFPELIAGPIVRGSVFLTQMGRNIGPTKERLLLGGGIFLQGLTKKVLIADRLSMIADPIFADPGLYSTPSVWCGLLAYALQIYCDFSGYSDMAIGTAKMIGYDLPENFNMPYVSKSITEFWRRWHMTLSSWLKDYLYISLGGNRRGTRRTYINLMLTMLLGGLWHGASWNFILWGGVHGVALAIHKWWLVSRAGKPSLPSWLGWLLTQFVVIMAWVPFRSTSFETTTLLFRKLFTVGGSGALWLAEWLFWLLPLVIVGHLIGVAVEKARLGAALESRFLRWLEWLGWDIDCSSISGRYLTGRRVTVVGSYVLSMWLLLIFYFAPNQTSPFIYFQF